MDWKKIGLGAGILASVVTVAGFAGPLLRSDAPPWAGIARLDAEQTEGIATHIDDVMKDYCEAERTHNQMAAIAVMRTISTLETNYANYSSGRAWPLSPCP